MASYRFENAGGEGTVAAEGDDIRISAGADGALDQDGRVGTGPTWQAIEICAPVPPGGEFRLLRVANASTGDQWQTRRDQKDNWPRVELILDQFGFQVSYQSRRLLIDRWQLVPSDRGEGWMEVLSLRAVITERRRNAQNPQTLDACRVHDQGA